MRGCLYKKSTTMRKIKTTILYTIILLTICTTAAYAQPGLPGEPEDTPIDGGVTMAIAATAPYGAKKLMKKKQAK